MESVIKGGEEWLRVGITQTKDGIELDLRIHPIVEEYFRMLSAGRMDNIQDAGNGVWYSPTGAPMMVYRVPKNPSNQNGQYSYEYAGFGFDNSETGLSLSGLNMAFLRIEGASNGIKLGVKTVMSLPARRELKDSISANFRRFVREHLTPIRLELVVTSREF